MTSKIFSIETSNNDYSSVACSDSNSDKSTFLIDSQADISLIKQSTIANSAIIDSSTQIKIKGVTQGIVNSIGTIESSILIDNTKIHQRFHVVPSNFSIPTNGILGKDFLRKYKCKLCYSDMTISLLVDSKHIKISFVEDSFNGTITIPPNCEITRQISLPIKEPSVILNSEISNGLYTGNTIIAPNSAYIRVININDTQQENMVMF